MPSRTRRQRSVLSGRNCAGLGESDEDRVRRSRRGARGDPGRLHWYTLHVRHSVLAGVIHGAVLLTAVGGVLGLDARRV